MYERRGFRNQRYPFVVKLGGSLISHVPDLVSLFSKSNLPVLIVPGGGIFADTVRKTEVDASSAHWMAIAAMDQYGWYIASRGMKVTYDLEIPERPVVLLPYCCMRERNPLPHLWSVTSDSVAAWIADVLGLDLLVLKSVDGIMQNNILLELVDAPTKTETVDPFFIPFVIDKKIKTTIINGSRLDRVEQYLLGEHVPGTRICTTF